MEIDVYGEGNDRVLLLLHGAAAVDSFANQYSFADEFRLVVPHLPGAGRAIDRIYDPETTVAELRELAASFGKKVAVMGHSVGGELALALVSRYPELFDRAVFLSAWVCPSARTIRQYTRLSEPACLSLRLSWLVRLQGRYWGYTDEQAAFMADYAKRITPEQYAAWFSKRIRLDDERGYPGVRLPMLAVCGRREIKEIRRSTAELSRRNPNCQSVELGGGHDFVQRNTRELNPLLLRFLGGAQA